MKVIRSKKDQAMADLSVQEVIDAVRRAQSTVDDFMEGQPRQDIRDLVMACAFWSLQNGAEDVAIQALYVGAAVVAGERH